MNIKHAVAEGNIPEILLHLENGSDFTGISLVHLLDSIETACANNIPKFDQAQKNKLYDYLRAHGAILTYEELLSAINKQLKIFKPNPDNIAYTKKLYRGLNQLIEAWQNNNLANQTLNAELSKEAIKKLAALWKTKDKIIISLSNIIEKNIKHSISNLYNDWIKNRLDTNKQEFFNNLLLETIIHHYEKADVSLNYFEQLQDNIYNLLLDRLKSNQLTVELTNFFREEFINEINNKFSDYADIGNNIIDIAKFEALEQKRSMTNIDIKNIFDTTLLPHWQNNLLPKDLMKQTNQLILKIIKNSKIDNNYIDNKLKIDATNMLINQMKNDLLNKDVQKRINDFLIDHIFSNFLSKIESSQVVCVFKIDTILENLFTQWQKKELPAELNKTMSEIILTDMNNMLDKLNNMVISPLSENEKKIIEDLKFQNKNLEQRVKQLECMMHQLIDQLSNTSRTEINNDLLTSKVAELNPHGFFHENSIKLTK